MARMTRKSTSLKVLAIISPMFFSQFKNKKRRGKQFLFHTRPVFMVLEETVLAKLKQ